MSDHEEIKSGLLERKEKLVQLLHRIERSARRKLDKSFEEQAIQRENEEVLTSLDHSLHDELKEIEGALERMEKGEYGICANCGEEIAEKRLESIPYAGFCINCAE